MINTIHINGTPVEIYHNLVKPVVSVKCAVCERGLMGRDTTISRARLFNNLDRWGYKIKDSHYMAVCMKRACMELMSLNLLVYEQKYDS